MIKNETYNLTSYECARQEESIWQHILFFKLHTHHGILQAVYT